MARPLHCRETHHHAVHPCRGRRRLRLRQIHRAARRTGGEDFGHEGRGRNVARRASRIASRLPACVTHRGRHHGGAASRTIGCRDCAPSSALVSAVRKTCGRSVTAGAPPSRIRNGCYHPRCTGAHQGLPQRVGAICPWGSVGAGCARRGEGYQGRDRRTRMDHIHRRRFPHPVRCLLDGPCSIARPRASSRDCYRKIGSQRAIEKRAFKTEQ